MALFRRRNAGIAVPGTPSSPAAAAPGKPASAKPAPAKPAAKSKSSTRRPHPGLLRRERRALLEARDGRLRELGGLVVELYRRGAWRDDLVHERCAEIVGIDARLAEIEEYLHGGDPTVRCTCGAALLPSSHFCSNCGRPLDTPVGNGMLDATMIAPPPGEDEDDDD